MRMSFYIIYLIIATTLLCYSCKKDNILTGSNYNVSTSTDTLLFDTLFTTIGSTTKNFKCYNSHNGILNISNISLDQGTNSPFRINVDGVSGVAFQDIQLLPGDSIFIFVEVTIDPNGGNLPLVVEDKITFNTNGNESQVILNAWGQDAHFHVNEIVEGTWTNDKPHVIYGIAAVGFPGLDSNLTLSIEAGTKVHGHANATLYVYKSSLEVNGTLNDPVLFQQDRTEDYLLYPADSVSGQWRGIYFSSALNSNITHAEIKNAVIGVQIDTFTLNHTVELNKIKINNSLYANILTQGANVSATNCLFGNSNNYSGLISIGGTSYFEHCTFANYHGSYRSTAAFVFKDYYQSVNEQLIYRPFDQAQFINCIMDGNGATDFVCDTLGLNITGMDVNVLFDHCAVKSEDTILNSQQFNNCYLNLKTNFINTFDWNFDLTDSSEIIDSGKTSVIFDDILERGRSAPNDLGCYEFQ